MPREAPILYRLAAAGGEAERGFEGALAALRAGLVVAVPTDTFYGLAVDPREPAAVARLLHLKGHPPGRAVLLLAASPDQVRGMANCEGAAEIERLISLWPAPLTLILPLRQGVVLSGCPAGTVAVRVPRAEAPRRVAADLGFPVTGTSANPAGALPAVDAAEVRRYFGAGVAVLLDGGKTPGVAPSTLLDLSGPEPLLRRAGGVSRAAVEEALGRSIVVSAEET
jgi:L-threonylcarbamoyladenylate synthase